MDLTQCCLLISFVGMGQFLKGFIRLWPWPISLLSIGSLSAVVVVFGVVVGGVEYLIAVCYRHH
jgi:hypothetical protein